MKLLIEIDEHSKNAIDKNAEFADGTGCDILPECVFTDLIESVKNGSVIPDNATNDDFFKAVLDEKGYRAIHDRFIGTKWLFEPYRKD